MAPAKVAKITETLLAKLALGVESISHPEVENLPKASCA